MLMNCAFLNRVAIAYLEGMVYLQVKRAVFLMLFEEDSRNSVFKNETEHMGWSSLSLLDKGRTELA